MTPTLESFFSGGGLLDCGLEESGVSVVCSYEIDEDCCTTLDLNFKRKSQRCDVTKKLVKDGAGADAYAFTYPCTKYSPIADVHGARTGDELYLHALRHMAVKPPEVYMLENVPGMRKFPVVMEAMTALPDYHVKIFCPIRSDLWLPQKRDRLIIFGSRKPFDWQPPTGTAPVQLADILEDSPQWDIAIPDYVYKRVRGEYRDKPIVSDAGRGDIAPTCVAHYSKDRSTRLLKDSRFPMGVRPYTVREYARLQGVPDWFQFAGGENAAFKMIGNGVSVPVGRWIGSELIRYFSTNAKALVKSAITQST